MRGREGRLVVVVVVDWGKRLVGISSSNELHCWRSGKSCGRETSWEAY